MLFIHGMRDVLISESIPLLYTLFLFYDNDTMQVVIHTDNLVPGDCLADRVSLYKLKKYISIEFGQNLRHSISGIYSDVNVK
ncbi:hypothetical protein H8356DRAFT_1330453 [Neocallimastix lanati (nom. inval.)]|nr:hypothetical protein H8356DRAFT_1330453 [Neocallimastix sp. JGI-2020a]